MSRIIPRDLQLLRIFTAREVFTRVELPPATGEMQTLASTRYNWVRDVERSDSPVDQQCNDWVRETGALIVQLSPPSVNVYQETAGTSSEPPREIRYFIQSVLYINPVSHAHTRPT
jgi:hypothetical protein